MTDSQLGRVRHAGRDEAIRLLGSVPHGRIVFTERALPAIAPACHVVDGEHVVVCAHPGAAVPQVAGQVVAYQTDHVGVDGLEWSVVVIGMAEPGDLDRVVRIRPELVTGQVLAERELPASA
jgi:hypothetical protein